jgi:methionyl-tRNA formyltransferase
MGARLVATALTRLDTLTPEPQPAAGATYAAKIDKAEARIDWSRPAVEVDRLIRGLSPFPGAWTLADGERLKILRSRLGSRADAPAPVLAGPAVACGEGAIEIVEAQREGRRAQRAADLLQGFVPRRLT